MKIKERLTNKDAWIRYRDSLRYALHCIVRPFDGFWDLTHETALFLHDLTDREPLEYEITVKTGYNPSKLKDDGIKVYTIKKELHGEGITTMQTSFGHLVPVYNMERTICDIIRNRNNTEIQTFQTALKQYAKRKDKNLRLLMQYAAEFHVDKILRQYFEVLL